jgi:hypothetical protein
MSKHIPLPWFWIRIGQEITIKRRTPFGWRVERTRSAVYRATPRNIERVKRAIWRRGGGFNYWTAYRPEHPNYAELFCNY